MADGTELYADTVLSNATPYHTFLELLPGRLWLSLAVPRCYGLLIDASVRAGLARDSGFEQEASPLPRDFAHHIRFMDYSCGAVSQQPALPMPVPIHPLASSPLPRVLTLLTHTVQDQLRRGPPAEFHLHPQRRQRPARTSAPRNHPLRDAPRVSTADGISRSASCSRSTLRPCSACREIENAQREAAMGIPAARPVVEMTIPSALDSTIAPKGKHVVQVCALHCLHLLLASFR
jgi:hypothetical protein